MTKHLRLRHKMDLPHHKPLVMVAHKGATAQECYIKHGRAAGIAVHNDLTMVGNVD